MSKKGYKIRNQQGLYFITFAVVDWVDVFTKKVYRIILINSLKYCIKSKGLRLFAWVIMSNHVHFIMSAHDGFKLSDILRDFKKHTSVKIIETIKANEFERRRKWMLSIFRMHGKANPRNETHQFWQQHNAPIELVNNEMIDQRLNYIHNNPVKAGIVEYPEEYIFSSARNYSDQAGLVNIEKL